MISMRVEDSGVKEMIKALPKTAGRAAEIALDKTAFDVRDAVRDEMKRVFDKPTRWTLNSLKVTRTQNHNMQASVWFKEPDRMGQHYLVPQVDGGPRRYKGHELGLGRTMFVPAMGAKILKSGAVSRAQLRRILFDLKGSNSSTGRKYVRRRRKHKNLYPGVYERFKKRNGKSRSRFGRGLRPVLLEGKQKAPIKPLLKFYDVANKTAGKSYRGHFDKVFDILLAR